MKVKYNVKCYFHRYIMPGRRGKKGQGYRSTARLCFSKRKNTDSALVVHLPLPNTLQSFHLHLKYTELPPDWVFQMNESSMELRIMKLYRQEHSSTKPIIISMSLIVHLNLTWMVHVHGKMVNPAMCSVFSNIPSTLTYDAFKILVSIMMSSNVCAGNPDACFVEMAETRKGKFLSPNKELVCYLDDYCVNKDGKPYPCTIRHVKCELLVKDALCLVCHKYRSNLRAMYSSYTKKKNVVTCSKTNLRYLHSPQKRARMLRMKAVLLNKERQISRLREKLNDLTNEHGVEVTKELKDDFSGVIKDYDPEIKKLPAQHFKRVFWEQQVICSLSMIFSH